MSSEPSASNRLGLSRVVSAARPDEVTYSRSDLVAVALLSATVSAWVASAAGEASLGLVVACAFSFFSFYLVGSLFAGFASAFRGVRFELPLRLLLGYAVVNTLLMALAWVSPLGMLGNFAVIQLVAVAILALSPKRSLYRPSRASHWAVALCALATTLWCQDFLDPIEVKGPVTFFKPWVDGFYHAVHIRIFAESHGASTIEDFRMTGVPARLYHYGVYMMPALVKQLSGIHSYGLFAGMLAPVGIFFTGLGACAFFGSIFGKWPGFAAVVGLLLIPDAAQQGMQNPFFSYHWLTHISPSATYGLALLSVAWLFVIQGSLHQSSRQIFCGWCFAALLVAYKLHYVVASSLLLLLVPAFFFGARLSLKKRAFWVFSALVFYVAALYFGQMVPGVPVIRFDGSSIGEILHLVSTFVYKGDFRTLVQGHMGRPFSAPVNLLYGVPYVVLSSLGILAPVLLCLAVWIWKRTRPLYVLFPLLLLGNFLLMFFGLALDFTSSTPDELSHRPVMIVYFFVAAWVGAALALIVIEVERLRKWASTILIGAATLLLVVPAAHGEGVQVMWVMSRISPTRIPTPIVEVAEYIRTHGDESDVFQDAEFDRYYAIAALSERRTFVCHTMTAMQYRSDMVLERSDAVNRLLNLEFEKLVRTTARFMNIRWFIRYQGARVNWPPQLRDDPAFKSGPFYLYDLGSK